jgi:hypothetical protein
LFTAQEDLALELACNYVLRKVSDPMGEILDRPFTTEEVEQALFQMSPHKAPGPDSFKAGFFQKHWALVKHSGINAMLGFLNGGDMIVVVNQTVLELIPKVPNPRELIQFGSISLCICFTRFGPKLWQTV